MLSTADRYLDADELMHLGLAAARAGKNEETIVYLKRALEVAPNEAALHYLIGTQYLQIGLNQRAVAHMERAIALNPGLDGARFQLGWIYWAHGNVDAAAETWKPLDNHGKEHPLFLFKTGLLHLAKQEYAECEENLRRGIEANTVDVALNHDMAQLLKRVQAQLATDDAAARTETPAKPEATKAEPAAKTVVPPKVRPVDVPPKESTAPKSEGSGKVEPPAKPKAPRAAVLSAYKQNEPGNDEA